MSYERKARVTSSICILRILCAILLESRPSTGSFFLSKERRAGKKGGFFIMACNKRYGVDKPTIERFLEKIVVLENGCWQWTGSIHSEGYGLIKINGKCTYAHKYSYQWFIGEVPYGLEIDHTCHNSDSTCTGSLPCLHRRCVNPDHLEAVTHKTNVLLGKAPSAQCARQSAFNAKVLKMHGGLQ